MIQTHRRVHRRLELLHAVDGVQVQAAKLLSCGVDAEKLLLKSTLLLGKIIVRSN